MYFFPFLRSSYRVTRSFGRPVQFRLFKEWDRLLESRFLFACSGFVQSDFFAITGQPDCLSGNVSSGVLP